VFERILVAVDGTSASYAAALFGAELAAPNGELHLLCVTDRASPPEAASIARSLDEACQSVLASGLAAVARRAHVASSTVAKGRALAAILLREEELGADLICLGSGRTRLRPGHVSAAVAREADACVALIRAGVADAPRISRIAVGLRTGPTAQKAAEHAMRIAAGTGAQLYLFAVVRTALREAKEEARRLLGDTARAAEAMGLPSPRTEIRHGEPAAELVLAVDALRADLLVVGAGQRRPMRPMGRVVTRLTSTCPCPLLICR